MALVTAIGRYECVASASCALVLVLLLRAKWAALEHAHAVVTPPLRVDTTVNVGPAWVTVLVPIWLRDTLGVQSVLLQHRTWARSGMGTFRHLAHATFVVLLAARLQTGEGSVRVACIPLFLVGFGQFFAYWSRARRARSDEYDGDAIALMPWLALTIACKIDRVYSYGDMPWTQAHDPPRRSLLWWAFTPYPSPRAGLLAAVARLLRGGRWPHRAPPPHPPPLSDHSGERLEPLGGGGTTRACRHESPLD